MEGKWQERTGGSGGEKWWTPVLESVEEVADGYLVKAKMHELVLTRDAYVGNNFRAPAPRERIYFADDMQWDVKSQKHYAKQWYFAGDPAPLPKDLKVHKRSETDE